MALVLTIISLTATPDSQCIRCKYNLVKQKKNKKQKREKQKHKEDISSDPQGH